MKSAHIARTGSLLSDWSGRFSRSCWERAKPHKATPPIWPLKLWPWSDWLLPRKRVLQVLIKGLYRFPDWRLLSPTYRGKAEEEQPRWDEEQKLISLRFYQNNWWFMLLNGRKSFTAVSVVSQVLKLSTLLRLIKHCVQSPWVHTHKLLAQT